MSERSLFIFAPDSKIRMFFAATLKHQYFDGFVYHLIGLNSIMLMIDDPTISDPYVSSTISMIVNIISGFFIGEAIMKIISYGFCIGPGTYLKDSWSILDFVIVLSAILNWILDSLQSVSFTFMRGFRALRALRPLRMISKDEGMKTVINSLLRAIPSLANVALINLLFLSVFSILGVQLFKGEYSSCNDSSM